MQHIFLPLDRFRFHKGSEAQNPLSERLPDPIVRIEGNDHQHLARVMRARVGEKLIVLDGQGNAFEATLVAIERHHAEARIDTEASVELPPEPTIHLTVAQALGKGDKFETVIQHGTEVGASAFLPVHAERCVVDLPSARIPDRVARWQQIAKGAAEQSHRRLVPNVATPVRSSALFTTDAAHTKIDTKSHTVSHTLLLHTDPMAIPLSRQLRVLMKSDTTNIATENGTDLHSNANSTGVDGRLRLILAIGPEGGWSPTEVSEADKANIPIVSLGPHVLRTETAALVAISQILYHFELAGSAPT